MGVGENENYNIRNVNEKAKGEMASGYICGGNGWMVSRPHKKFNELAEIKEDFYIIRLASFSI